MRNATDLRGDRSPSAASLILFGVVAGTAWAAALRAFMVEIAGRDSRVEWFGTFALILLPGALVGALLGLAEYLRRTGGRRGWRWLAAAPLLFTAPLFVPGAFLALVTTGIGGGAVAVPLVGMLGGYVTSRRGPLAVRLALGLVVAAFLVAGTLFALGAFAPGFDPAALAREPRSAWTAVLDLSLMIVLIVACSVPHRAVVPVSTPSA
jgi:hypothetical protein